MRFPRAGGVLSHPTCFPGPFGIGDLGPQAFAFLDWLADGRQGLWQVLPLGPTGYADSPYQSLSAFAGNPLLISPERLINSGLLPPGSAPARPDLSCVRVDFGAVAGHKHGLLRQAYRHFLHNGATAQRAALAAFRLANDAWLPDYALFMALKAHFGGGSWLDWPRGIRTRARPDLDRYRLELAAEAGYHEFVQWAFQGQWLELRAHAHRRGIRIIGDLPIFAAEDSADVWARPELFQLDDERRPTVVAGVPPDAFSATGQRWGNPHYRWQAMAGEGFSWWLDRIGHLLGMVDIIRVDHFRGFESGWEIPSTEPTAIHGHWAAGPGAALFEAARARLGDLPVIAEDLGVITSEVEALRRSFGLPGMKVLQFAFGPGQDSGYLPHHYEHDFAVYPGTHDNNTVVGWFQEPGRSADEKSLCLRYLHSDGAELPWDFIRAAWSSVADVAVVQLQDVMGLGAEARMNHPSTTGGNWQWRFTADMLTPALSARLGEMACLYGRACRLDAEPGRPRHVEG
jgi:4-alpha-glucanotransferase